MCGATTHFLLSRYESTSKNMPRSRCGTFFESSSRYSVTYITDISLEIQSFVPEM